ncbi:hypothetical protein V1522DRAFT_417763, partial [Lipomyces starkeyi]
MLLSLMWQLCLTHRLAIYCDELCFTIVFRLLDIFVNCLALCLLEDSHVIIVTLSLYLYCLSFLMLSWGTMQGEGNGLLV